MPDLLLGVGKGGSGLSAGHTITTITDNGDGTHKVTTQAAHGLSNGANVTISGNVGSGASFNQAWTSISGVTATTFNITDAQVSPPADLSGATGTGGQWV